MASELEKRVVALEKKVAQLQQHQQQNASNGRQWLNDLYGKLANDPIFEKAMELGRKYRRSLRPRTSKSK
jgi:predicted TIM-barrel fold metal-dependent hydrolase